MIVITASGAWESRCGQKEYFAAYSRTPKNGTSRVKRALVNVFLVRYAAICTLHYVETRGITHRWCLFSPKRRHERAYLVALIIIIIVIIMLLVMVVRANGWKRRQSALAGNMRAQSSAFARRRQWIASNKSTHWHGRRATSTITSHYFIMYYVSRPHTAVDMQTQKNTRTFNYSLNSLCHTRIVQTTELNAAQAERGWRERATERTIKECFWRTVDFSSVCFDRHVGLAFARENNLYAKICGVGIRCPHDNHTVCVRAFEPKWNRRKLPLNLATSKRFFPWFLLSFSDSSVPITMTSSENAQEY